jgi:hypothetical protein
MLRYWMVCLVVPACFTHWFTDGSPSNLPLSSAGFHQRQFPENNASSTRHHPAAHDRITRGIRTAVSNKPTERKTLPSFHHTIFGQGKKKKKLNPLK